MGHRYWNKDTVGALTNPELANLLENTRRLGHEYIIQLCEQEFLLRHQSKARHDKAQRLRARGSNRSKLKLIEDEYANRLTELAKRLSAQYDFSEARAKQLSTGTLGFRAHSLLSKKGTAKTGGLQKQSKVLFDRYISYRLQNEIYALNVLLKNDEDESMLKFQVHGPKRLLGKGKIKNEMRKEFSEEIKDDLTLNQVYEEFKNYESAESRFCELIDKVAPKIT
jgi:hypothetical protein